MDTADSREITQRPKKERRLKDQVLIYIHLPAFAKTRDIMHGRCESGETATRISVNNHVSTYSIPPLNCSLPVDFPEYGWVFASLTIHASANAQTAIHCSIHLCIYHSTNVLLHIHAHMNASEQDARSHSLSKDHITCIAEHPHIISSNDAKSVGRFVNLPAYITHRVDIAENTEERSRGRSRVSQRFGARALPVEARGKRTNAVVKKLIVKTLVLEKPSPDWYAIEDLKSRTMTPPMRAEGG
ncbi:uncharacterized protein BDR25DRAFT_356816 [Lindgomyces ingoldianus]|uniref:Uncharacterized protein n=1 Tax=Lindgomyces ingoldianus TaxID=673940 RepID=A0ACB6QQ00_9PLEO|nr:uncharacterized protein BDR25DRAFT_356816 [Lindgomyces ingoldianus]KAF2469053.1 hypothetical protein BDR25DRAFT_356816 [Lindgomyces ingoldianus]